MKTFTKRRVRRSLIALAIAAAAVGGVLTVASDSLPEPAEEAVVAAPGYVIDESVRVTVLVSGGAEPKAFYGETRGSSSFVGVREFAAALGAWFSADGDAVTIKSDGAEVTIKPGDKYLKSGDHYIYVPAGGAVILGGELFAPVRAVAEALGAEVGWSNAFQTVLVAPGKYKLPPADYSPEDLTWMARIITAEARGESFEGKIAVGNVVMNRLSSPGFPNTVHGVIFDNSSGIQFTPAYSGAINNTPPEECIAAAEIALRGGADIVGDSLYFASTTKCWAARNRDFYGSVGAHNFYV